MDIEQLREIVKRKDGEGFCQFFRQLKPEDILKLTKEEYKQIMSLAQQMGKQKIVKDDSFFDLLYSRGLEYLKIAMSGGDVHITASLSLFYHDLFLNIYHIRDKNYTSALVYRGISLLSLAKQGVDTIENLKESMKCYDAAASIFKREKSELNYAGTMMNKGSSLLSLAEQGVDTIENLKESMKCCDAAASIFKREKSELNYSSTMMSKGNSLLSLAEQGVIAEKNFALALKLFNEAEDIFLEKGSLLMFVVASANHIIILWWKFQETKNEHYLKQAKKLCEQALTIAPRITHPAKEKIIELLNRINAILADKYLALDESVLQKIFDYVKALPRIEKKIDLILHSIKFYTKQIIENIKRSGVAVSKDLAKSFTNLAEDLNGLNEQNQRKLLEELSRLLKDSSFQNALLNQSPPEKRASIRSILQRIRETVNDIAGHIPAALLAHQIYIYFDRLLGEVLYLTDIHSALVKGMVLLPLITFKNRLSKS